MALGATPWTPMAPVGLEGKEQMLEEKSRYGEKKR